MTLCCLYIVQKPPDPLWFVSMGDHHIYFSPSVRAYSRGQRMTIIFDTADSFTSTVCSLPYKSGPISWSCAQTKREFTRTDRSCRLMLTFVSCFRVSNLKPQEAQFLDRRNLNICRMCWEGHLYISLIIQHMPLSVHNSTTWSQTKHVPILLFYIFYIQQWRSK